MSTDLSRERETMASRCGHPVKASLTTRPVRRSRSAISSAGHPDGEGLDVGFRGTSRSGALTRSPFVIERIADTADVGLRLLQHRNVEKDQRLAQMMIGAEPADGTRRIADDAAGLAVENALSVGTRSDIDGIFQNAGNGPIVFGRHEQDSIRFPDTLAETHPVGRRRGLEVLVIKRQSAKRDNVELKRRRREPRSGLGNFQRKRLFAKAADDDGGAVRGCHE